MKKLFFILIISALALAGQSQSRQYVSIVRDSFSLKHPADWKVDTKDEDYDPDAVFSIEAPDDESMVFFMIFSMHVDPKMLIEAQIESLTEKLIKNPELSDFDKWGNFQGKGKILKGKLLGLFKGSIRLFVYATESRTMLVMEQFYDKNYEKLKPDYDQIASSFVFR